MGMEIEWEVRKALDYCKRDLRAVSLVEELLLPCSYKDSGGPWSIPIHSSPEQCLC